MSILKQVLGDAWASISRPTAPAGTVSRADVRATPAKQIPEPASPSSRSGLKAVILNWKSGENDPFTVFNRTIRHHLEACGKNVEIIDIKDDNWPTQVARLGTVEFAFTWQGLGSGVKLRDTNESLWDRLKIPLICIHGDHPCHMPANHELESFYCFHLYTNADSARYSNRYFRRVRSASVIDIPQLHRENPLEDRTGDHFVVAKNISDPATTEHSWREQLPPPVFDLFMAAAETLKARIARERYVEIHDVLDDLIVQRNAEWLSAEVNPIGYHDYHSKLDHHLRSHRTVLAVTSLRAFPLLIYGRGWDSVARNAPSAHVFEPGRNMANSQRLYYSRFGLIDVSPSTGLHDRTRRAMVNGVGFLSSANLEDSFSDIEQFDSLFFNFNGEELQAKAAAVMRDPDKHAAIARDFARVYHARFHFRQFVNRLDTLAKIATGTLSS